MIFFQSRKNGLKSIENIIEIANKLLLGLVHDFLLKFFSSSFATRIFYDLLVGFSF
jgi:hypothetical protein